MKVLLMHNRGNSQLPSGETVVFESEAAALRQMGVAVVTRQVPRQPAEARLRMDRANVFWSPAAYRDTRRLLADHAPDLVHVHGVLPDLTASVFAACQTDRVPVVQTLHNFRWLCVEGGLFYDHSLCDACLSGGAWHGVARRCARKSIVASSLLTVNNAWLVKSGRLFRMVDRFLAVSSFVRDIYRRAGFPEQKLVVKYNGVSLSQPRDAFATGDVPTISFAGRLDVAKGSTILQELPKLLPDFEFQIAGTGPAESALRERWQSLDNVRLLGRISGEEVRRLMQRSAAVLVPSLVPESFGLAAAEAMACGVPVIAARVGGLSEIVEQSGGGLCVPPAAGVNGFATALRELLQNPGRRRQMGTAGHDYVASTLTLEKTTAALIEIYQDVIRGHQSHGNQQRNLKTKPGLKDHESTMNLSWQLTEGQQLLCDCIQASDATRRHDSARRLLEQLGDDRAFELARRNDVASLVAHALGDVAGDRWRAAHQTVSRRISGYLAELDRVARLLDKAGIGMVALKNAGIARGLFPCPGCCPMGDLDVMVCQRDFRAAHRLLLNNGYHWEFRSALEENDLEQAERSGGGEYWTELADGEKLWLELQWRPVAGRWIRPDQEPDCEDLLRRSLPIANSCARLLSPEDNLLQVAVHTAKHSYVRAPGLRLHTDVDRIVHAQPIDWDRFLDQVIQAELRTAVYFSLAIPAGILQTPIPQRVWKPLQPPKWKRRLLGAWIRRAGLLDPQARKFSRLRYVIFTALLYDDVGGLLRGMFPPPGWMMQRYRPRSPWTLPWLYLRRLGNLALRRETT